MRYYDVHLHLPSPDRDGLDRFLKYAETEPSLVGGNLILNRPEEVELVCRFRGEIPPRFTIVPYYNCEKDLGFRPESGWYKVHPRLSRLDASNIATVVQQVSALVPTPKGVIVDCFPWGPELEYNISLAMVIQIATALPDTHVLVTHGGGYQSWAFRAHTVSLKNVLYDFSATLAYYIGSDVLKPLQNYLRFVPDRVLFGTDWPVVQPAEQLAELKRLALEIGISPDTLEATLLANAERFWSADSWRNAPGQHQFWPHQQ
jgi:hypothetical protein